MTDPALAEIRRIVQTAGRIRSGLAVEPESRLVEDLAIDSLDLVDVFLKIQDHFDIVIDDDDVPNLRRVSDLCEYVSARSGSAAA